MAGTSASLEERFWGKVDNTLGYGPEGDCWLWFGSISNRGYGRIRVEGRWLDSNRACWLVVYGILPALCVLHKCDIRHCVNPDHLFLGDRSDNYYDQLIKGKPPLKNNHQKGLLTQC